MSLNIRQRMAAMQQMQENQGVQASVPSSLTHSCSCINVLDFEVKRVEDRPSRPEASQNHLKFQDALDFAFSLGGGIVFVPAGNYELWGSIFIPPNVTLEGIFKSPPMLLPWGNKRLEDIPWAGLEGTILHICHGKNQEHRVPAMVLMGPNSVVKGLNFFYPYQGFDGELSPYPWTISGPYNYNGVGKETTWLDGEIYSEKVVKYSRGGVSGIGVHNAVIDVNLGNCWNGISMVTFSCTQHFLRGIYGQPLNRGILIDGSYDVSRIEDVHFWPFWVWPDSLAQLPKDPFAMKLVEQTSTKAIALTLRKTDWQIVHNFFCFGYHIGIRFENGIEIPGGGNGQISNLNMDGCDIGLDCQLTTEIGYQITNANIVCYMDWSITSVFYQNGVGVLAPPDSRAYISIRGGSFWGAFQNSAIIWDGSGLIKVNDCYFHDWNMPMGRTGLDERLRMMLSVFGRTEGSVFSKRPQTPFPNGGIPADNPTPDDPGKRSLPARGPQLENPFDFLVPAIHIKGGRAMIQNSFFQDRSPRGTGASVMIEEHAERVMVTGNMLTGNPVVDKHQDSDNADVKNMTFNEGNMR